MLQNDNKKERKSKINRKGESERRGEEIKFT
jgi:hypothetical protein